MSTNNPYSAPQTGFSNAEDETYEPSVLSFSGRIGRLRFLAYSIPWNLLGWVAIMVLGIVAAILIPVFSDSGAIIGVLSVLISLVVAAIIYVPMFTLAVRRLNDMNQSGWLSLIYLIPLVGLLLFFVLVFAPGTKSTNKYGPKPVSNSVLVVIGALFFPLSSQLLES